MLVESEGSESCMILFSGDKVVLFCIVLNCIVELNKFYVDLEDFFCIMKQ